MTSSDTFIVRFDVVFSTAVTSTTVRLRVALTTSGSSRRVTTGRSSSCTIQLSFVEFGGAPQLPQKRNAARCSRCARPARNCRPLAAVYCAVSLTTSRSMADMAVGFVNENWKAGGASFGAAPKSKVSSFSWLEPSANSASAGCLSGGGGRVSFPHAPPVSVQFLGRDVSS
mgnify:CR=1 FL=1